MTGLKDVLTNPILFTNLQLMSSQLPRSMRALVLKRGPPERKPVYHDALLEDKPIPVLKQGQVLVKIGAAAYNHREVG